MRKEDRPIFDALDPWQAMGLCIEREASGEPREGKIGVGTVILERVDHRKWDGQTIKEVVFWPWQFSWTMPEAEKYASYYKEKGPMYYNEAVKIAANWTDYYNVNPVLRECCDIAEDMIAGAIPRDPDLAAANCCQYLNPKTAAATEVKWLKQGMIVIKDIGHHRFFKEV